MLKFFSLAVIACLAGVAAACGPECQLDVRQSVTSPDGRHVATVAVENCHATSPFVTIVNIRATADEFDPDDCVYSAKGKIDATVAWASNDVVVVQADESNVFRRDGRWRRISVRYEPVRQ